MKKVPTKLTLMEILDRLDIEEARQLDYSLSYVRNAQMIFHRNNPDKRIRTWKDGKKSFAGRIK